MKKGVLRIVFVVACTLSLVMGSDIEKLIRDNNEKRMLLGTYFCKIYKYIGENAMGIGLG
jgi:hypothetical protein